MTLLPRASFRKTKAGIKLHTQIDLRGPIPTCIHVTEAKLHDVRWLDDLLFEPGAIYVMDRGYMDFSRLAKIDAAGAFFVTRAKTNLRAGDDPAAKARAKVKIGPSVMIERNAKGEVVLTSDEAATIQLAIKGQKPTTYSAPVKFTKGGTLFARAMATEGMPGVVSSRSYEAVVDRSGWSAKASNVEAGEGDASQVIDGNPKTYWHTQWKNAVAPYPHSIEVSFGQTLDLAGITVLPRQGRSNGRIKDYFVETSTNGSSWKRVAKGTFPNQGEKQKIQFRSPQKASHVRLTGKSSHNGASATMAELGVIKAK